MAQAGVLLDQDQFSCSICLDLLKDPVTIPCGHSYCMGCIKGCWDQKDQNGVYSCPQCRETFTSRPVLRRNTMFAEVVEKLKKTGLQAAPPAHCYTGPGDVACDVCTGRKLKAIKSCLVCLASYCETHLKLHNELHSGNTHNLMNATGNLQEKICSPHDKTLEIYCRTDQQCICYLCTTEDHRGHDTVSTITARTEIQKQLGVTQRGFQNKIQEREKELQDLRQAVQSLTRSAQAAVEDSERIFTELIRSIERRRFEVKELIRDQQKAAVSEAEGLLERLEQEIAEMRRRDAELEQLSHTEDHIHFLQHCKSQGCFQKKQRLKCTHEFCAECLRRSVESLGLLCPVCHKPLSYIGDQPEGEMTWRKPRFLHMILISYNIPNGIQTEAHPNSGKPFTGIKENAFLPDTPEGMRVLQLLKRAFDQKLVFTVEATSEGADRVVYTDIPHANNWQKCDEPRFLEKVKAALRAKGIE
ncbi:hypothetical protein AGOR_G00172710 [Albula goreensis]|uniref:RING-type E3 ubiquitin transferase n=1 Tax=Albula goreensis TaxID=1534307 RepID=A0A8T3CYN8_9TELE|nr:hypothetical protein AGOR_G00172710 [Albula goreensis]